MKYIIAFALIFAISIAGPALADNSALLTNEQEAQSHVTIGDISSNNDSAKSLRYYAPPGDLINPMAPNVFFQQPDKTYQTVLKVKEDLLKYFEDGLTTRMQMNLLDESKKDAKRVMVRPYIRLKDVADEDRLPLDVPMGVAEEKVPGMISVGTITVLSDSKGSISPDVFAQVQVEAWKLGGQLMELEYEGFQRLVHNEASGFGFTWSGSTISGGQASSTTGVMGFGKTWGQAGLYDHPFITVQVLRTSMIVAKDGGSSSYSSGSTDNYESGGR